MNYLLEELILHLRDRLECFDTKSDKWDKYISRMAAEEAYEDILDWALNKRKTNP